jgi:hypothetical protein
MLWEQIDNGYERFSLLAADGGCSIEMMLKSREIICIEKHVELEKFFFPSVPPHLLSHLM